MNEASHDNTNASTLELGESYENDSVTKRERVKTGLRRLLYSVRSSFSAKCDASFCANLLEELYFRLLSCSVSVFGLFLTVLGSLSLILAYVLEKRPSYFLTDVNNLGSAVILLIGLAFITCKTSIGDLLSDSYFLSKFSIVYSQKSLITSRQLKKSTLESYSTSLFTGILSGLLSVIYPSSAIVFFLLSLVYVVFIFNRPECGMLLSLFLIPILSSRATALIFVITFASLLYKYLRGKRHIDFKAIEALVLFAVAYIVIRFCVSDLNGKGLMATLVFCGFFLIFILTVSLVRTTSMLRRTISLIVSISHFFAIVFILFYLGILILGKSAVMEYVSALPFESLVSSITGASFIVPFLAMVLPVNLSVILSSKNSPSKAKHIVYFVLLFIISIICMSYEFILTLIVGIVLVFVFGKPRLAYALIPCPVVCYGIIKLYELIPDRYLFTLNNSISADADFWSVFIKHPVFGTGNVSGFAAKNTFCAILLSLGVFGTIILAAVIGVIIYKSVRSVFSINKNAKKSSTYAYGLLSGIFCYMACGIYTNVLCDFRIAFLFAIMLSLAFTSGRCFEADFIDTELVREYSVHE